ncbi:hypothetical protein [Paraburkholderia sp.]|uniref:hypothetical protein n=1 Tax=Paraburkholderia sp. TaxID=1926495 RepID=UPI0025F2383B|nr:hypothetical protein [Paraburkholderia sp.]
MLERHSPFPPAAQCARPRIPPEMQNRLDAYLDDPGRHLPTLNGVNGSFEFVLPDQ